MACPGGICATGTCCTGCFTGGGTCLTGTADGACGYGGHTCSTCGGCSGGICGGGDTCPTAYDVSAFGTTYLAIDTCDDGDTFTFSTCSPGPAPPPGTVDAVLTGTAPGNYSERIVRDQYLFPFEAAVTEAGVMAVMPSYNEVDGVPSHKNRWLLEQVQREFANSLRADPPWTCRP